MGNWIVTGISLTFSTGGQLFSVSELLYKKNVSLDDQTRRAKSPSQPVHLRGARPVMRPLLLVFKKKFAEDHAVGLTSEVVARFTEGQRC